LFKVCTLERTAHWQTRSMTNKHTNTIFSLQQQAHVDPSLQTLHGGRGRRDHSQRWESFFDLTHSFSYRGEYAHFWPLSKNNTGSCHLRGILPVTVFNRCIVPFCQHRLLPSLYLVLSSVDSSFLCVVCVTHELLSPCHARKQDTNQRNSPKFVKRYRR